MKKGKLLPVSVKCPLPCMLKSTEVNSDLCEHLGGIPQTFPLPFVQENADPAVAT